MLWKRFEYDGMSVLELNELQMRIKKQIDDKVSQGIYEFESVPCPVCNGADFETLASKDRYGLYVPVVVCKICGLVQVNPRMNQEAYNNYYNHEYHKLHKGTESPSDEFLQWQYQRGQSIFRYLKENHVLPKPPSDLFVLEVGCGAGGVLRYFREMGCRVKGIDLGEEYLEFGRTKYDLDLSVGTVADITLDRPPDVVIYAHVLEHILTPSEELAQVRRMLSDDSMLYVEVPGIKKPRNNAGELDFLRNIHNAHIYYFTLTTLRNLLHINGFQLQVGDEFVRSVFKKSGVEFSNEAIVSDYADVLEYLQDIEKRRMSLLSSPYRERLLPRRMIAKTLRFLGIYEPTRKLYRKLKRAN